MRWLELPITFPKETGNVLGVPQSEQAWAVINTPLKGEFSLRELMFTGFSFQMLSTD